MKIGQEVYLEMLTCTKEPIKTKIKKIGRKYITVDYCDCRFYISDLVHFNGDYSPDYQLWLSMSDLEDELERRQLANELYMKFSYGGIRKYNLSQLKRIKEIIKE